MADGGIPTCAWLGLARLVWVCVCGAETFDHRNVQFRLPVVVAAYTWLNRTCLGWAQA